MKQQFTFKEKLKHDVPASVMVFLVALPLCLGIALASGAPAFSGVLAGIIGGIVVGRMSGSQLSVSGPAVCIAGVFSEFLSIKASFITILCM
jgi:MFS superfamily sulfate permease-like transporter